jgi:DNA polymerase-3 subunit delta
VSARVTSASTYLVRGDDASLVAQEVRALLAEVVGDRDHGLVVEEIGGGPGDELSAGAVVDACLTPPFLIDRRVVVVRDAGRLLTGDAPRLVGVVQNPLPTTVLVLVGGGGTVPAPLVKAINAHGRVIDVTTTKAGDRKAWLRDHLRSGPVKLEPAAENLLVHHVGEDLGRVEGLLGALGAAYGEGARVSVNDLAPYLGEAGTVPRYELTDAIDRGDSDLALVVLHRMLDAGGLAPIQIVATLHGHFANMLALDGDDIAGEGDAAAVLGVAPFVAKKAFEQSRRLGSTKIADAINLIARADLAVRGESGLSDELVVEILVARLARQTRPTRPGRPARQTRPRVGGRR